ncbi:tetratricopeptide repeat protein [Flavobacterium sp. UBA6135]|uniref:tetratricopeptide repeat protein n=1 Tax=Flavobacterium sp. UBA6135 TaxID=1946553 RepID=UPI0025BE4505|nr:tetratricopeptide repeat protein [Flavobacterium sp. UBA6135]
MATYNKRGFKAPKPKDIEDIEENVDVDVKNSTTAEVFSTLDENASKAEEWVAKNQKIIFGVVGVIAFLTVAYLLYGKFVTEPKEIEAAEEMFVAQQNFQQAVDATTGQDSLFTLALNGADGKYGFIKIAEEFSGTDAGNLANYYAGIAYLNIGKNTEAIAYLDKFSSKDIVLSALAKGAIGDAFAQRNQLKDALEYYEKAARMNSNELTTPRFLYKAGQTALTLGQKQEALNYFTEIKESYEAAPEARNIDGLIGLSK